MGFKDLLKSINPFASNDTQPANKMVQILTELQETRPTSLDSSVGANNLFTQRFPPNTLYAIRKESDVLSIIVNSLRQEIFRNGFEVLEEWKADPDISVFDPQEIPDDTEALDAERLRILKFFKNVNANHQTIIDVFKELEDDINTVDDAYMLLLYNYLYEESGDFEKDIQEVLRVDPKVIELVHNDQEILGMDKEGNWLLSCPSDRTNIVMKTKHYDKENPPVHPRTGHKLYPVHYKHTGVASEEMYYFSWEIIHKSRYNPTKTYGHSPILHVWRKVATLIYQDDYMRELYHGKRPPKGLLVAKTGNRESLNAAWKEVLARAKRNPHMIQLLGLQGSKTGGGDGGRFAEFFDFMRSLDEMQFTEVRNEMRNQIGAIYGVTPLFQNDVSTSGGLNNEGRQITVTNRSAELKQQDYNETFFPAVLKAIGAEFHVARLKPSEEQDEMAKLERLEKSIQIGESASRAGLEVEFDEESQEVVIKSGKLEAQQQDMFGQGPSGFEEPIDEDDDDDMQASNSPEGTPSTPQTGGDILNTSGPAPLGSADKKKSKIPPNAVRIGSQSEAPQGAKVGRGPQGGLYYVSGDSEEAEDTGSDMTDGQEPPMSDSDPANDIEIYEGREVIDGGEEYANGQKPLTTDALKQLSEEFNSKVPEEIKQIIQDNLDAFINGNDTQGQHKNLEAGVYSEERQVLHVEAFERYDSSARVCDANGKCVFMAGIPGAGKSYAVSNLGEYDFFEEHEDESHEGRVMIHKPTGEKYLVVNCDDFKQMLPEFDGGKGAALVHNESADLRDAAIERYRAAKINIVVDGTFSKPEKDMKKADDFRSAGYSEINMVHVDTPAHLAMKRAWERFSKIGSEDGDYSGRFTPFNLITQKRDGVSEAKNLKDSFDGYTRVDNSVFGKPSVVEEAGIKLVGARGTNNE